MISPGDGACILLEITDTLTEEVGLPKGLWEHMRDLLQGAPGNTFLSKGLPLSHVHSPELWHYCIYFLYVSRFSCCVLFMIIEIKTLKMHIMLTT